jgi:hypothetical protein
MRAGEEFTFRAIVSDAAGCLLGARPTWAFEAAGRENAELSQTGMLHVPADAKEGEFRLTAAVGGRSALVTVEVASTNRYDALLRSGAFNAAGEVDEAASVAIASQSIGAASAVAEDRATSRKQIFVWLVGTLAVLLGLVAAILVGRSRAAAKRQATEDAARRARRQASPPLQGAEGPEGPKEVTAVAPGPGPLPFKPPGTICPVCGSEFGPESKFCGRDGATLLPVN